MAIGVWSPLSCGAYRAADLQVNSALRLSCLSGRRRFRCFWQDLPSGTENCDQTGAGLLRRQGAPFHGTAPARAGDRLPRETCHVFRLPPGLRELRMQGLQGT